MEYEGYIFYIDLLGISYLSKEKPKKLRKIIEVFHQTLYFYLKKNKNLKCIVISDSVFLYIESKLKTEIINSFITVSNIFRALLKRHILCRAGCSYGKFIVLKSKVYEYNILGSPVTEAVKLEGIGKGHRIFINETVYNNILTVLGNINREGIGIEQFVEKYKSINIVSKYTSYINYTNIYILDWMYTHKMLFYRNGNVVIIKNNRYFLSMRKILNEDNIKIRYIIDNENNFELYDIENNNFKEHIKATSSYVYEYFSKTEELSEIKQTLDSNEIIKDTNNNISITSIKDNE